MQYFMRPFFLIRSFAMLMSWKFYVSILNTLGFGLLFYQLSEQSENFC